MRRKLHNRVMELQGNIRVLCRARPPTAESVSVAVEFPEEAVIRIRRPEYEGSACDFEFDSVFGASVNQAEVFEVRPTSRLQKMSSPRRCGTWSHRLWTATVCVSLPMGKRGVGRRHAKRLGTTENWPLLRFKVCRHTMEGPLNNRGVNFRAVEAVLEKSKSTDDGLT